MVRLIFILAMLLLSGCQNSSKVYSLIIREAGFESRVVIGQGFQHQLYLGNSDTAGPVHVYLAGDGTPWMEGRYVSRDPTPRQPLALRLMAQDPAFSIYLGRPCYHRLESRGICQPELWTSARYSEEVVASMARVLASLPEIENRKVVLIGYSGGGVLATLLAARLTEVTGIVTVSGNLDIEMWVDQRGFLALDGSLNPVELETFPESKFHVHLIGDKDVTVAPAVTMSFVDKFAGETWHYPGFDHSCCWENEWDRILGKVRDLEEQSVTH